MEGGELKKKTVWLGTQGLARLGRRLRFSVFQNMKELKRQVSAIKRFFRERALRKIAERPQFLTFIS